jgi:prepilin peptidase CpaA
MVMEIKDIFPISLFFYLMVQLFVVSYTDLKIKKIPNIWPLSNLFVFFILFFLFPGLFELSWRTLFYPTVFFFVGLFFFSIKIVGAGDSKYLVSLFLLVPLNFQEVALASLVEITFITGVVSFFINTIKNFKKIFRAFKEKKINLIKECYGKKFPFAPVILGSWIIFGWKIQKNLF